MSNTFDLGLSSVWCDFLVEKNVGEPTAATLNTEHAGQTFLYLLGQLQLQRGAPQALQQASCLARSTIQHVNRDVLLLCPRTVFSTNLLGMVTGNKRQYPVFFRASCKPSSSFSFLVSQCLSETVLFRHFVSNDVIIIVTYTFRKWCQHVWRDCWLSEFAIKGACTTAISKLRLWHHRHNKTL